jgi:hypothetical protein
MNTKQKLRLVDDQGTTLSEFWIGDLPTRPDEKTLTRIKTVIEQGLQQALTGHIEKLLSANQKVTRGQIIDAVDSAWSDGQLSPKLIATLTQELVAEMQNVLLPLAQDIVQQVLNEEESLSQLLASGSLIRDEVANALYSRLTKEGRA